MSNSEWFAAKTVCRHRRAEGGATTTLFEERVVLLHADDFHDALDQGEAEVQAYCQRQRDVVYTGYIHDYRLSEDMLGHGTEVFSLMGGARCRTTIISIAITMTDRSGRRSPTERHGHA